MDAIKDYLVEIAAEKKPEAVQGAKYVFDAWVLPALGSIEVENLTTDQLIRWRNKIATAPKHSLAKKTAAEHTTQKHRTTTMRGVPAKQRPTAFSRC